MDTVGWYDIAEFDPDLLRVRLVYRELRVGCSWGLGRSRFMHGLRLFIIGAFRIRVVDERHLSGWKINAQIGYLFGNSEDRCQK